MNAKTTLVSKKTEITASDVRAYLGLNPAFFEDNADLLIGITVPHGSGSVVSLVEKQVEVLREENMKLQHQMRGMINNARQNETMYKRINTLMMRLTLSNDLREVCHLIEEQIVDLFVVELVNVRLFKNNVELSDNANICSVKEAELLRPLLAGQRSVSGPTLEQKTMNSLFGPGAEQVASSALISLGESGQTGIIAIGSFFEERFTPEMSTDYLDYLSEVLSILVEQHC